MYMNILAKFLFIILWSEAVGTFIERLEIDDKIYHQCLETTRPC